MRVQVLRQFLNEEQLVTEGQIIRISDVRAKALIARGLVNIPGVNQDAAELLRFLDFVREIRAHRYLEIGCRNGDTFYAVMRAIGERGYGLAIDLPENGSSRANLAATVTELRLADIACDAIWGNSQDPAVIGQVAAAAPFDLILIDADHRYEGVKRDFEVYGKFASIVALHDVAAPDGHMSDGYVNGVGQYWREISAELDHQVFVTPGSNMGFGILRLGGAAG